MDKETCHHEEGEHKCGGVDERGTVLLGVDGNETNMLGVDEFYNIWAESFYFRLMVDVRKSEAYLVNHASTAVHYDPSKDSLGSFIQKQVEESPLFEKVVFYDELPFNLSKPLKRIASKLQNGRYKDKSVLILAVGISSVRNKYDFMWNAKDEDITYPSLVIDDFLYLGEEESALEKDVVDNLGLTHVLSVLPVSPHSAKFTPQVTYCQCPIQDLSTESITKYFKIAIEFIDSAKTARGRILVHCMAGISRSATLVIVYIMHALKLTLREAYIYVKQRRAVIRPNTGFLVQLIAYETERLGRASLSLLDFDRIDLLFP